MDVIDRFASHGFAVIPQLFEHSEIQQVREALDGLFSDYDRLPAGHTYDLDGRSGNGMGKIPAIRNTLSLLPGLASTRGLTEALNWAERLMGPGAELLWDAAIYKPPGESSETPWHQDEGVYQYHRKRPRWIVYFWVAVDDIDASCGAIRFVSGSHRGPLHRHAWRNGDSATSLEVVGLEEIEGVTIPLGQGDATVHHLRTLHGSGANSSGRCRKAWVLGIGKPRTPLWMRRLKRDAMGLARRSL